VHHLVFLAVPVAALAAAGRFRLVAGWFVVLTVSFPVLGHSLGTAAPSLRYLAELVTDLPGLSAVAAVALLPRLVLTRPPDPGVPVAPAGYVLPRPNDGG
jgi:hypothetical protein